MSENEIITKVRDILNEHGGDNAISIATDRVLLEDYIKSAIPDAVVMLAQKGYRVNVAKANPVNVTARVLGFISLIYAMDPSGWNGAVTKLTEVGSPEYIMAMNKYTPRKSNNPMCYMVETEILSFMPAISDKGVVKYNKEYNPGEGINAEPKEATAVCYMTAALVLGMFGDDAGKQRLSDICMNIIA